MQAKEYKTKQKEQILDVLRAGGGRHWTAAELTEALRRAGTPVGSATVYRFLEALVDSGRARKYTFDGGHSACYQYVEEGQGCEAHFHLKCTACGRLFHVECEQLAALGTHILEHHGFRVDHTKTVLYGLCRACRGKSEADERR